MHCSNGYICLSGSCTDALDISYSYQYEAEIHKQKYVHLLRCLVCPESKSSACTLHDCGRIKPAKYAGLVVLAWRESSFHNIVGVGKLRVTHRTLSPSKAGCRQAGIVGTVDAEDVAVAH